MDILMNLDTGDMVFQNGESPVTSDLATTVAQRLFVRLRTFQGEWFLNTLYGVPYNQRILGRKTTKARVDTIFQDQILSEAGVSRITEFESTLEGRRYTLVFRVRATDGTVSEQISIT